MRSVSRSRLLSGWLGVALALAATAVQAVPSYARQTGQGCVACHVSFPELTPYGRWFKLSGYTIGVRQVVPLAGMALVGVTQTRNNDDGTGTNTPATARERAPRVRPGQRLSCRKGNRRRRRLRSIDIRPRLQHRRHQHRPQRHRQHRLALGRPHGQPTADDVKLLYGVTLHNNPTAQDVWNSTPAFGFPSPRRRPRWARPRERRSRVRSGSRWPASAATASTTRPGTPR